MSHTCIRRCVTWDATLLGASLLTVRLNLQGASPLTPKRAALLSTFLRG